MSRGCRYDDAGPYRPQPADWDGRLWPGAEAYRVYLEETYGGTAQGAAWRPNTAAPDRLSIHAERAVDYWGTPRAMQAAALEAQRMHEAWGIQLVIFNGHDWTCDQGVTSYGGPCPHVFHVHFEVDAIAGRTNTIETYRGSGFMQDQIDQLLDAEHDTRRLALQGFAQVLRSNERILRAEFVTRQRLEDAGVIDDPKTPEDETKMARAVDVKKAAEQTSTEAAAYELKLTELDREHDARKAARRRRDGG